MMKEDAKTTELTLTPLEEYKCGLAHLLQHSRLWDSDTHEEKNRILQGLKCPVPTIRLFKYYGITVANHVLENLATGQLSLTNPVRFNDPFDGLLYVNEEVVRRTFEEFSLDKFKECITAVRTGTQLDVFKDVGFAAVIKQLAKESDESLNKIYSNFDEVKNRGITSLFDQIPRWMRSRVRVCCFSESGVSPLMWAHYAQVGKGICIEYELPTIFQSEWVGFPSKRGILMSLIPVLYSRDRYDATHIVAEKAQLINAVAMNVERNLDLSCHDQLAYLKMTIFKSSDWGYEKEWRLFAMTFSGGDPDYVSIPAPIMKRVIFGNDMNSDVVTDVVTALSRYAKLVNCTVPIQRLVVDTHSKDYLLNVQNIAEIGPSNTVITAKGA